MKRAITLLLLTLFIATPAWAGSFTVTTTPKQDKVLAWWGAKQDKTPQELVNAVVRRWYRLHLERMEKQQADKMAQKFFDLTPAKQAQVKQILGIQD